MKYVLLLLTSFSLFTFPCAAKFIQVDEFQFEYEISGSGKHVILLEAGAHAGMSDWDPVYPQLVKHGKIIRYSRVANGNSTAIERHFTSGDYAEHARTLLDNLNVSEAIILVAHSYGASIAREFAAKYPEKVKALLLLEPASEHDVDIIRAINLEQGNKEIAQIKLDDMANGLSNNYLDFWSKRPLPDHPEIKDIPVTVIASIKKVEKPANLFFTDKARRMWGELWQNWVNNFPQGSCILTENSGHFIQDDEPELVVKAFLNLVKTLENTHEQIQPSTNTAVHSTINHLGD